MFHQDLHGIPVAARSGSGRSARDTENCALILQVETQKMSQNVTHAIHVWSMGMGSAEISDFGWGKWSPAWWLITQRLGRLITKESQLDVI